MEHLQSGVGGNEDWVLAHEALERIARQKAELDWEEGTALLRAMRSGVHQHLGYASFVQYVERLFGYSARTTDDKLRTALAVEQLPELSRELREGNLNWSAARELSRVATVQTEREWLDAARGKTVRQIEGIVSGRVAGDRPTDPPRTDSRRHVLRFEIRADTLATFREAVAALRRRSPDWMEDDDVLLQMAREILRGPTDTGRASYQVAITVCEKCGRGFQDGAGESLPVDASLVEAARCDAQCIGRVDSPAQTDSGSVGESSSEKDAIPTPESTHVGEQSPTFAAASQRIPPAVRRWILRRDRGCCVVPGCSHATFVDIHHLRERAEGGNHDRDNLVTLCAAHHRAVHRGQLRVEGSPADGLQFRRADGSSYSELPSARAIAS
ncbi:MAG TPA: HNH endonuclease signature motif containing protein, partial [Polyangiaceae bacterium]